MSQSTLKLLLWIIAIVYIILPIDLIPDAFGFLGRLDEIFILYILWSYYKRREQKFNSKQQTETRTIKKDNSAARPAHEILEIDANATLDEITRAYKLKAARYHPDKVEHLGKEFKLLAHEHLLEIQQAYDKLKHRH